MPTKPDRASAIKVLCDMGFYIECGRYHRPDEVIYWLRALPNREQSLQFKDYFDADEKTPELAASRVLCSIRAQLKQKAKV